MPSPKQNQLLRALESGVKLHEALREPGMPSKATLGEWLDNPEFDRLYTEATEKGTNIRLAKLTKGAATEESTGPRPAVLRGLITPAAAEKGRELSQKLTDIIGDGDTYQPAPSAPPKPLPFVPTELQQQVLDRISAGDSPTKLVQGVMRGYNANKLAAWRQNPEFVKLYEAAKAQRGTARTKPAAAPTGTGVSAADSEERPAEPEPVEAPAPAPEPVMAEPAPNQSEPGFIEYHMHPIKCTTAITSGIEPAPRPVHRFGTVVEVPDSSRDWLTLEEATDRARERSEHLGKNVYVVELVGVAERVTQVRHI